MNNPKKSGAVITNLLWREDAQFVHLGDIFLEEMRATFVPYAHFHHTAPIVQGAAALFGGILGAVSIKFFDGSPSEVMPIAKKARKAEWGMSADDRALVHQGAIQIERNEIESAETEGGLVVRTSRETFVFGYVFPEDKDSHGRLFKDWCTGLLPYHQSAVNAGMGRNYPAPQSLLVSFLRDDSVVDQEMLKRIVADEEYMERLFDDLSLMNDEQRERIMERWDDLPQILLSRTETLLIDHDPEVTPKESSETKVKVPNRIFVGYILAGVIAGVAYLSACLLFILVLEVKGGGHQAWSDEELRRGMSMGIWSFASAYLAGAIVSITRNSPRNWEKTRPIIVITTVGLSFCGIGHLLLLVMKLADFGNSVENVVIGICLCVVLGLIFGGYLYRWLHDHLPFLFPFLREAKTEADAIRNQRLKGEEE